MTEEEFPVGAADEGLRLDRFLAIRIPDVSRTRLQRWLEEGRVKIGRIAVKPGLALKPGWIVRVTRPDPQVSPLEAQDLALRIVHEDEEILVIDKPAGLTVHPGAGRRAGTLANGLLHLHPDRDWPGAPERPGIVHRLDRLTSGLLVVACEPRAYLELRRQIAAREVARRYLALAWGTPSAAAGTIDAAIGRDPRERKRMAVAARGGRGARTHYRVLRSLGALSLLEVRLETGRTHQIRVHLAHIGFPVFGDAVYGGGRAFLSRLSPRDRPAWTARLRRLNRQALHAYHLSLRHPRDGARWVFESPLPAEIDGLLRELAGGGDGTDGMERRTE
ncbi:MAG: RluA family pseudouridine synthase [Candidatus Eisenbacteria bacterium]|nr:RluA family pseudouridine synthase [Candidatus Eisenbacteria bacterium]